MNAMWRTQGVINTQPIDKGRERERKKIKEIQWTGDSPLQTAAVQDRSWLLNVRP